MGLWRGSPVSRLQYLGFKLGYEAKGMWIGIIIGLSVAAVLHALRFRIVSSKTINSNIGVVATR